LGTDRQIYRPGDRVYFRYISEVQSDDQWFEFAPNGENAPPGFWYGKDVAIEHAAASGSFRLPLTVAPGYYEPNDIFIAQTKNSPYELDAAPLESPVPQGSDARFIVSAQGADGPARVRLHYAWHATDLPDTFPLLMRINNSFLGPLQESDVTTNALGNAQIVLPAATPAVEVYIYAPNTHDVAAYARTNVTAPAAGMALWAPAPGAQHKCVPLGVRVTDENGAPQNGRLVHVVIRPDTPYSDMTPNPAVFTADVRTQVAGYGFTQWCASSGRYWYITVSERGAGGLQTQAPVFPAPTGRPQGPDVLFTPLASQTKPDMPAQMLVRSTADGDALVVFGAWRHYRSQVVRISGGVARFSIDPPTDVDDFQAMLFLPGATTSSLAASTTVTVTPKRHLLHVSIGCSPRTYLPGTALHACVSVRDWRGARVRARLFGELTQTSAAGIAAARARSNAAYDALFGVLNPPGDFATSWAFLGWLPKLELYPTPTPRPSPTPRITPAPPSPTPAPHGPFPRPQTLAWIQDASTNAGGDWRWRFPWPRDARPGQYLMHVIALADDGSVGEAYASMAYASPAR
jgi:hypothetical protein